MTLHRCRDQPLGSKYSDVSDLFRLLFAVSWGCARGGTALQSRGKGLSSRSSSSILTRRDVHGPATPDKAVLRAEQAFVLSDLYSVEIPTPAPCPREPAWAGQLV